MNPNGTAPITVLSEAHPSSSKLLNVNISASIGVVVVWFYRWSTFLKRENLALNPSQVC